MIKVPCFELFLCITSRYSLWLRNLAGRERTISETRWCSCVGLNFNGSRGLCHSNHPVLHFPVISLFLLLFLPILPLCSLIYHRECLTLPFASDGSSHRSVTSVDQFHAVYGRHMPPLRLIVCLAFSPIIVQENPGNLLDANVNSERHLLRMKIVSQIKHYRLSTDKLTVLAFG